MPNDNDGRSAPRDVSRRHLFKQVGLAGAAAAVTATAPGVITAAAQPAPAAEPTTTAAAPRPPAAIPTTPLAAPRLEALETLTAAEADTLEAIVARLIPTDENGPGATEARAAHYIDRALTGPLRTLARQLCRQPRRHRRLRAGEEGRAVRQARGARSGFRARRHGEERRHRLHAQRRRVLHARAHPHHPGHVLRSLLRRQRQLRRLGSDRLSRHPACGHRRRAAHEGARQARARPRPMPTPASR